MNKNTVKKLASNPHYVMGQAELDALAKLLDEEAEEAKRDETEFVVRGVEKNRVAKTFVTPDKTTGLEEQDNGN